MQPTYYRHKTTYNQLSIDSKTVKEKGWILCATYFHSSGYYVQINMQSWNGINSTVLIIRFKCYRYTKRYRVTFSTRGLSIISAAFLKEVITGKVNFLIS